MGSRRDIMGMDQMGGGCVAFKGAINNIILPFFFFLFLNILHFSPTRHVVGPDHSASAADEAGPIDDQATTRPGHRQRATAFHLRGTSRESVSIRID